jgi:two-component system, OmpR family, phosphate regulon sensor histidine kinase PhoR
MVLTLLLALALLFCLGLIARLFYLNRRLQAQLERTLVAEVLSEPPEPPEPPELPLLTRMVDDPISPIFAVVMASIDAGLVVVSDDDQVLYLNPAAEHLLALPAGYSRRQGLIMLLRDHQTDSMVREVLNDGEPRETTLQLINSNRTLRVRCNPLHINDELDGAVLIIRDVTQISLLERARRDLVANVSHELRTPLASLKLLVETLQSQPPADVGLRMLSLMYAEIDAITQLVDELHELSQIESGRVRLQMAPAYLEEVLERAMARIKAQADRKSLFINAAIDGDHPPVLMDSDRIGQVLINMLHNAVKFTADRGEITIRLREVIVDEEVPQQALTMGEDGMPVRAETGGATATMQAEMVQQLPMIHPPGAWMLVSIKDTGIGIPAQDLPRIFERFYKVDRSRNRNAGGTGLGLAIAKHLVEGHGGRLWAESTEGMGSTFYFTLPIA